MSIQRQLPHHLHFGGLSADEEVKLFLRRHPIVFFRQIAWFLVIGFIPVIVWVAMATQTDWFEDGTSVMQILFSLGTSLIYLFWVRGIFTMWLDYYLDVWVVTNKRIIRIEHVGMFHRKVSEQELSRVQDVTTETSGFLQTVMKFGNIKVQTAAETENFFFNDIENPELVAKEISDMLVDRVSKLDGINIASKPAESIPEAISPITLEKK